MVILLKLVNEEAHSSSDKLKQREQEIQVDPHVPEPSKSIIVKLVDQATPKFAEGVGCSPLDPRGC